jgi:putative endonuclease
MPARWLQFVVCWLDALAPVLPWNRRVSPVKHLRTGRRGEDDAYFWLRRQGYVMVARNWRSPRHRSEIDLIGWDAGILCFVEVKTRQKRDLVTAEAAVDYEKQKGLRAVAQDYLGRLDPRPAFRFDVVTVYYDSGGPPAMSLYRNSF